MYINQTNALFDLFKWVGRTGENMDTDKMRTETDQNTRNAQKLQNITNSPMRVGTKGSLTDRLCVFSVPINTSVPVGHFMQNPISEQTLLPTQLMLEFCLQCQVYHY